MGEGTVAGNAEGLRSLVKYTKLPIERVTYLPDADEYWLQSAGEEFVGVDGGMTTLTDPDGEHPGISIKLSARPGSGNYHYGNYARMAKLADEQDEGDEQRREVAVLQAEEAPECGDVPRSPGGSPRTAGTCGGSVRRHEGSFNRWI